MKTLDIGCGAAKRTDAIGMDKRKLDGVDVVHDIEVLPWPFDNEQFDHLVAWHVFEHLKPWLMIEIMDECWRVLLVGGTLRIGMPSPESYGFYQDPGHVRVWCEATPRYFDPDYPQYQHYTPKPWKIELNTWYPKGLPKDIQRPMFNGGSLFILRKRAT